MATEGFSLDQYLLQFDPEMLSDPECRRQLTRYEPLLFALLYLPHHLRGEGEDARITLSEFHVQLAEAAKRWALPTREPRSDRDAYVCPREAGKSTWLFLILPLWAAAHGHRKFIGAFAHAGPQAEMHLGSFKHELDRNQLLRADFPDLCSPGRRPSGVTEADTKSMLIAASGFVFAAKGIDSQSLGMKVGARRPDLLILDDIEPNESNYSDYQKAQRLSTLQNAILPLNIRARVVIAGTVTMPGSIIHDLVKTVNMPGEEQAEWVADEKIRVHYYRAIITDDETGERRSLWPEKWPLEFLVSIEHTRSYRLNYDNNPMARDGDYWNEGDIIVHELPAQTAMLLSIDPATTSKKTSDFTGLAVIAYSSYHRRCVVLAAWAIRVPPGTPLRRRVLAILKEYPRIRGIVVEVNQGGEVWENSVLHNMPVKVKTVHQDEAKEVRAARLLGWYQTRPQRNPAKPVGPIDALPFVVHERRIPVAEEQLIGFPKAPHDDVVDAIGTGVDQFLRRRRQAGVDVYRPGMDDEDLAS
ncbi:hypothetical protein BBK82_03240 [Lentzea guizhouensis]|uniref:Terminase large subunit gp17-like C-terminal domain-containing protein n=1 Tax=Lentzea guizhouensis TaxID=1586287 RepID=A0A1B2HC01_9PSEU|nr:hypothetical protein [Lentzea guizhouensis]ANZ35232.1 hypothetical protein BBK82_03240 [Lentzea guizhouensis]